MVIFGGGGGGRCPGSKCTFGVKWRSRTGFRSEADRAVPPMNDIKEYFTANKHPLIRRSARINQRLRAAACHGRASETPRSQRVALWAAAAAAGTADGGR